MLALQLRLVGLCSALVATRAASPQNRIDTLIDSQVNFKFETKRRIYFLLDSTILLKVFNIKLIHTNINSTTNLHLFIIVHDAKMMTDKPRLPRLREMAVLFLKQSTAG